VSKKGFIEHKMTQETKNKVFPTRVTFFVEPDGNVTIDKLFSEVLPLALSLNPDDKRIEKFLSYHNRGKH